MFNKAVFPGKYIQGLGAISELPELIKLFGKQGLILASPSVKKNVLPQCAIDLSTHSIHIELFQGECCENELTRLSAVIREKNADVLVGMGGGKTIDTAKIVADRANIPVIIIPTIASTDAPCSGCAVLYSNDGVFDSVYYQKANPAAVLAIHNGLTALEETHSFYHGEKVAFGVLAGLQLTDESVEESETVFSFCENVGLPTTLADIGIGNADPEKLMVAAEKACAPEQSIHHEAGIITPQKILNAMLAADAIGRSRKK